MDYPKSVPGVGLVGGKFVDENPATGQQGSLIPSGWGNQVTDELLAVIAAAGLEPSEEASDQLLQAFRELQKILSADSGMVVISNIGVTHWEVPDVLRSGKKKARVRGVGGGGGGGKSVNPQSATLPGLSLGSGGGGGGGGGFEIFVDLSGVSSVVCTIGAGGVAATVNGKEGGAGGTTSFGAMASAMGGLGGSIIGTRVAGGAAALGAGVAGVPFPGGGSGSFVSTTAGNINTGYSCGGGGSLFSPNSEFGGSVVDGVSFGGGGSGGFASYASAGAGHAGIIVIEW